MPIDANIPLEFQAPNPLSAMSSLLQMRNMIQQNQNMQTENQLRQQALQSGDIDLQAKNQANNERQAAIQYLSDKNNYTGKDGTVDLDAMRADMMQKFPQTWQSYYEPVAKLHQATSEANNAAMNLDTNTRGIVSGTIGVLGRAGITDPNAYNSELDRLGTAYKDNPHVQKYIGAAKDIISTVNPKTLPQLATTASQSLLNPVEQQSALSPTAGMTNTGGQLAETVSTPSIAGQAPHIDMTGRYAPLTMPTGSNVHVLTINGKNYQATQDVNTGQYTNLKPIDEINSPTPISNPTAQQSEELAGSQKHVQSVRDAGDQAPIQHNINRAILSLSKDVKTYPGSDVWNNTLGAITGPLGGTVNVNNYQELGKYLEKNAIQSMQQMGGSPSDARLAAASAANGSTKFNPGALQEVTKFNDAATTALEKYRQGLDKAVGLQNPDYASVPTFKSAWTKNLDVNIFRVENAIKNGDMEELQKIKNTLGAKGMQELAKKQLNLETLARTGRLP